MNNARLKNHIGTVWATVKTPLENIHTSMQIKHIAQQCNSCFESFEVYCVRCPGFSDVIRRDVIRDAVCTARRPRRSFSERKSFLSPTVLKWKVTCTQLAYIARAWSGTIGCSGISFLSRFIIFSSLFFLLLYYLSWGLFLVFLFLPDLL